MSWDLLFGELCCANGKRAHGARISTYPQVADSQSGFVKDSQNHLKDFAIDANCVQTCRTQGEDLTDVGINDDGFNNVNSPSSVWNNLRSGTQYQYPNDTQGKLELLRELAVNIQVECNSNPLTCLITGLQCRYVAVEPACDFCSICASRSCKHVLDYWREGHLAYWADAGKHHRRCKPDGTVLLTSISSITRNDVKSKVVHVRYTQEHQADKLPVTLHTSEAASSWQFHLSTLLVALDS